MKNVSRWAMAALCLAVGVSAQAAAGPEVNVRVTGTIIPASCALAMPNGGVVNYGNISAAQLSATSYTRLNQAKFLNFNIICSGGAAKVGLKAVDNRADSKVPGILTALGQSDLYNYGLGSVGSKNTGGYAMQITNSNANFAGARPIVSLDDGNTWRIESDNKAELGQGLNVISWSRFSAEPYPVSTLSGRLEFNTFINKTTDLDLSNEIKLDGLATLELRYL